MEKLNTILQKYVADGDDTNDKLLGASFIVTNKNEVLYSGSAGRIGLEPSSKSFTTDSFTWVASLTKLITVTCVMQTVQNGLVALDDDVRELVPEINKIQLLRGFTEDGKPILEETKKPITLGMLLTHTVGLPYDTNDTDILRWSKSVGRKEIHLNWTLSAITTAFIFPPGEGWVYGIANDWAALVLEKVTGKSLGTYMQEKIFDPLAMQDTGFWPEKLPQTKGRMVQSSFRKGSSLTPFTIPLPKEHELESGGAGLFTTAHDYALFLKAFLAGKLLNEDTLDAMFKDQLDMVQRKMLQETVYKPDIQPAFAPEFPTGLPISSGIGGLINLEDVPGKRKARSMEWTGALNSRWWVDRESGIAAVMVVNVMPHGDSVPGALYDELEKVVYGELLS